MLILIEKDGASRVPKECTLEQAQSYAAQFPVFVVGDDGETMPMADWVAANVSAGQAPKPDGAITELLAESDAPADPAPESEAPSEPEATTESGQPE